MCMVTVFTKNTKGRPHQLSENVRMRMSTIPVYWCFPIISILGSLQQMVSVDGYPTWYI